MRELNGKELQGYIQQRQSKQVRTLGFKPKLAIVTVGDNKVIDIYVRLKKQYGEEIGVEIELEKLESKDDLPGIIKYLNEDDVITGIIVQLPIEGLNDSQEILDKIIPDKDVDGLGSSGIYDSATALAILWLLAGYNVDLRGKQIAVVGQGKLVGGPLTKMLKESEQLVSAIDINTPDKESIISNADIIISAVGEPGLITDSLVKDGAVVVDAGTTSIEGKLVGDVAQEVYDRKDISITPYGKGGVGPLTIAALFDNLIKAATK